MAQDNTEEKELTPEEMAQAGQDDCMKDAADAAEADVREETAKESDDCTDKKEDKMSRRENKEMKKEKEKIEKLEKELEEAKAKVAKEKDDYLRLMAEFDNFRRRSAQEKMDLVSVASEDTIKGLLPVLDDCERAMEVLAKSADSTAAKEGTELIYNKLLGYLKTKGLAAIEARDQKFDTDLHEAVAQFPVAEEEKKGKVFDVVQTGYTLNGKVIRFAKVVVGI